jgi:hypothetical protein
MNDSDNNSDGRDGSGRFAAGNKGGPGNPFARKVGQLRSALLETVTEDDMRAIAAKLVAMARGGNLPAIRELIERTLGRPVEADLLERLEQLEQHLARTAERTR